MSKDAPRARVLRHSGRTEDQTPPHNIDAERSVLGAILISNELLETARAIVLDTDFYRDAHRRIFLAMAALHDQKSAIDFVTLCDELGRRGDLNEAGGPAYVASLLDGVPKSVNLVHYARVVHKRALMRTAIERIDQLRALAYNQQYELLVEALHDVSAAVTGVTVAAQTEADYPLLIKMSEVERQDVRWLWTNRLAYGAITLLVAEPGMGKSWLSLEIAARLTTNRQLPGGPPLDERVDVLIMAAEDAPETTIKSRLQSLGADNRRVHFCVDRVSHGQRESLRLIDTAVIERAITESKAKLLVIDPVNSFMTGDSYNDVEVRRVLTPLVRLATERQFAILGLMHHTKDTARHAIHRTIGSIGFTGIARIVMNVAADKDDPRRRWLVTIKNNLGQISEDRDAVAYALLRNRLVWDTSQRVDYEALLNAQSLAKDAPEQLTAAEFLQAILTDDRETWPLNAAKTVDNARRNGIAPTALHRARRSLGIKAKKFGFGDGAEWRWYQPRTRRPTPGKPKGELPLGPQS